MNEFYNRFQTFSDEKLMAIVEKPEAYQSEAVKTAHQILKERNLSTEKIQKIKQEIKVEFLDEETLEEEKKERRKKIENKVKKKLQFLNPIQKETPSARRMIKLITLFFAILFLLMLYKEFFILTDIVKEIFTFNFSGWDYTVFLGILPFIYIPVAITHFYKRKKMGWILLFIYCLYTLYFLGMNGYFAWKHRNITSFQDGFLDVLYTPPRLSELIFPVLIYILVIWALLRKDVRMIYFSSKK